MAGRIPPGGHAVARHTGEEFPADDPDAFDDDETQYPEEYADHGDTHQPEEPKCGLFGEFFTADAGRVLGNGHGLDGLLGAFGIDHFDADADHERQQEEDAAQQEECFVMRSAGGSFTQFGCDRRGDRA